VVFNLCFSGNLNAGLKNNINTLNLNIYKYLSDNTGVIQPQLVAAVNVGDLVKFSRADLFEYSGRITEIEETPEGLKIYGVTEDAQTHFGFALIKGGIFAGAVVDKKETEVHTLEFSLPHKGYILLKNAKHNKSTAINI
jgi:hypothetical protein